MSNLAERDFSNVEFIDAKEQQYFAEAHIGQEVWDFLHSPTGKLLHGRAKQVVEQAKVDLLDINPTTRRGFKRFKEIQNDAWQAQRFIRWCAETIEQCNAAVTQLEFYRSET